MQLKQFISRLAEASKQMMNPYLEDSPYKYKRYADPAIRFCATKGKHHGSTFCPITAVALNDLSLHFFPEDYDKAGTKLGLSPGAIELIVGAADNKYSDVPEHHRRHSVVRRAMMDVITIKL